MSSEPRTIRFKRSLSDVIPSFRSSMPGQEDEVLDEAQLRNEAVLEEIRRREEELTQREAELQQGREAVTQSRAAVDQQMEQFAALLEGLHRERIQMLEENEEAIVALSLSVTRKVLQHEIENGSYKIGEIVRGAIDTVRNEGTINVKVNPQDYELAQAAVEKVKGEGEERQIALEADESVAPAACLLETDSGRILSDVAARLQRVENTLMKGNSESNGV